MLTVPPSVELIHITPNGARLIEIAGRTCYKSEDKITDESADAFVRMIRARGHMAIIEFTDAVFRVVCDRGVCYSDDTDVLTTEGWKPWPEVRGDEVFATLAADHSVEFHPATEIIREEFEGDLYGLHTSAINLHVTPAHSMYVQKHDTQAARRKEEPWQLLPAREIIGKRVSYKRDALPRSAGVDRYVIDDFVTTQGSRHGGISTHTRAGRQFAARVFARFLGYWLAEGSLEHTNGSAYQITLFQNIGPVLQDMLVTLTEMGYSPNVRNNGSEINKAVSFCDAALYSYLKPYHGALNKRIPRDVLNTFSGNDLRELILAHAAGDGSVHHLSRHVQAYTISCGLADDLQEAALHVGISATTWIDNRVGKSGGLPGIVHRHPCYVVSYVTAKNTPLVNHGEKCFKGEPHESWIPYSGMVYCATVPNHTLYVRRNGRPCWSGNSHEFVRHRLFSYAQESTRFCNYGRAKFGSQIRVIQPPFAHPEQSMEVWRIAMGVAEQAYLKLLELGESPQIARAVLPTCLKTELVGKANLREWLHFLALRTAPAAHPQMREVAEAIEVILRRECPAAFEEQVI